MLADIQAGRDERDLRVDEVGITGIRYPVAVADRDRGKQDTIAEVSMSVDLAPGVKGAHLSRFVEVLHETAGEITLQAIPAHPGRAAVPAGRRQCPAGVVVPVLLAPCRPGHRRGRAPGIPGLPAGQATAAGTRVVMGVRVPVTSVCPCSKAISDYGAHNQRTAITICVQPSDEEGRPAAVWAEDLIEVAEATASMPGVPGAEAAG